MVLKPGWYIQRNLQFIVNTKVCHNVGGNVRFVENFIRKVDEKVFDF